MDTEQKIGGMCVDNERGKRQSPMSLEKGVTQGVECSVKIVLANVENDQFTKDTMTYSLKYYHPIWDASQNRQIRFESE